MNSYSLNKHMHTCRRVSLVSYPDPDTTAADDITATQKEVNFQNFKCGYYGEINLSYFSNQLHKMARPNAVTVERGVSRQLLPCTYINGITVCTIIWE